MKMTLFLAALIWGIGCNGHTRAELVGIFRGIYESNLKKTIDVSAQEPRIPLKIHQIWIGPRPVPEKFLWLMETWKAFHPEWEYKLWTNEDVEHFPFVNKAAFDRASNWGMKADILRYEILYQYGGLYVDSDFECVKAFDELNYAYDFYAGLADHFEVNNALIGAAAGSRLMLFAIEEIKRKFDNPKCKIPSSGIAIVEVTGPVFFSEVIAQYYKEADLDEQKNMIILPVPYFYPFPNNRRDDFWKGPLTREDVHSYMKPETMGIHYWATSWW